MEPYPAKPFNQECSLIGTVPNAPRASLQFQFVLAAPVFQRSSVELLEVALKLQLAHGLCLHFHPRSKIHSGNSEGPTAALSQKTKKSTHVLLDCVFLACTAGAADGGTRLGAAAGAGSSKSDETS